jgi:predicted DNA-binding protein with PD1-like motif
MQVIEASSGIRTLLVCFRRGEYIVEGLSELVKREGIDTALITSGIGALDICKIHAASKPTLPPIERSMMLEGHIQLGSLQGSVAGGELHIHVVVADNGDNDRVYCGHLEPGTRCCYRTEVALEIFTGVKTTRVHDAATGLIDIVPVED